MNALPWTILFLPLLACGLITLCTHRDRKLSAGLSIAAVVIGFILSTIFIGATHWQPARESVIRWLDLGDFQVDLGLRLDPLSLLMLLIVTGVASVIHIYSWGYMREDPVYSRFFAYLHVHLFHARHCPGQQPGRI